MKRSYLFSFALICLVGIIMVSGCTSGSGPVKESQPLPVTHADQPKIVVTTPVRAAEPVATTIPAGMTVHSYPYVLKGVKDTVSVVLSDPVYADYSRKADPAWKSADESGNSSYYLAYINDPEQQPYIAALAKAIEAKTPGKDDQARIAIALVQHIPYKVGGKQYRYPYEVLYKNQGVCGEKSMLLALLLKDLGFGSSVFYLLPEDHMTTGIKASSPYDYRNSGYAFIEATEPYIITDSMTDNLAQYSLSKTMEVTPVGTGQALQTVVSDYNDARQWAMLESKIKSLSAAEKQEWNALNTKYDLSYYT